MAKREIEEKQEKKYLTYEEVEQERKRVNKERLNTFLRVMGLVTTILLIGAGLFDILFEMSYFGKLSDPVLHSRIWEIVDSTITTTLEDGSVAIAGDGKVFDNAIFGVWFPKAVITLIYAAGVVGIIYLITFSVVDFVDFIKNAIGITKQGINDNVKNIKDALPKVKFFGKKNEEEEEEVEAKKTPVKRKKKKNEKNEYGYSDEELDALLRGEQIEAQKNMSNDSTKPLFSNDAE